MTNLYWVEDQIDIVPPLNWAEIRKVAGDLYPAELDIEEVTVDTDEGTVTRKCALAIVPSTDDKYGAGGIQHAVQLIVDACPGHEWVGHLTVTYADAPELPFRLQVADGRVVKTEPVITWPEPTTCVRCHKAKTDTAVRINPFVQEVNDETVWEPLCEDCTQILADDV